MLRKLFYGFLILFFILASVAVYFLIVTVNRADESVVQPLGDFVQELVVPATPVIMPDPALIVNQINDVARLETAVVDLEKVITAERGNTDFLFGALGETLIFVAKGRVVAGVDFSEMEENDIQMVNPNTVMVHLPPARIFDDLPVLDTEESYVADRDTGLLTRADVELETEVRQAAEDVLLEEAIASGVIERADANAETFIRELLNGLGFEQVVFTDAPPPEPSPFVQEVPKGQELATPTP